MTSTPASLNAASAAPGQAWFTHDRFGMFIHFGLYAMGARGEWLKNHEEMTTETYDRYFELFDPDLHDPREWARLAREAGMKYVVITTKHHDGFCLWNTQLTDFKITNTPYGKDLIGPFVAALRSEGLKVGFYYSVIDWHHPEFPIDGRHPQRNSDDAAALNVGRDVTVYTTYLHGQVEELLTSFGKIDVIWFDFSYPDYIHRGLPGKGRTDWDSEKLVAVVRRLQPDIIIGDRLDLPRDADHLPDLVTPEQYTPRQAPTVAGRPVRWEACHTFSGSWGYHRDEATWKDAAQLINMLVDTVSLGGNLLMNVGPDGRGAFDRRAKDALQIYADWTRVNARSIYGAGVSNFTAPSGCRFTQSGNRLYLHIQTWPFRHIHIDGLLDQVKYAQFLHDASELHWIDPAKDVDHNIGVRVGAGTLTLELPVVKPEIVSPVVELILKS
jgi:alpha-L-fucosidase